MELKEMFEPIINFIKGLQKKDVDNNSKTVAKERLKLVLMQDRASVSPDFFEMMKKEIIEVIKKYIEIDEDALEVQLTRGFEDGLEGPALYANIPIKNIKPVAKKPEDELKEQSEDEVLNEIVEDVEDGIEEKIEIEELDEEKKDEEVVEKVEEKDEKEDAVKEEVKVEKEEPVKNNSSEQHTQKKGQQGSKKKKKRN